MVKTALILISSICYVCMAASGWKPTFSGKVLKRGSYRERLSLSGINGGKRGLEEGLVYTGYCISDNDCEILETCNVFDNFCRSKYWCESDNDCGNGEACDLFRNRCRKLPMRRFQKYGSSNEGEPCFFDFDCKEGLECVISGFERTCLKRTSVGEPDLENRCLNDIHCEKGEICDRIFKICIFPQYH